MFSKKRKMAKKTKDEKRKIADIYAISIFKTLEKYQISDTTSKAINLKIDKMVDLII